MKLARLLGLAILPLSLAACGADEGEPGADQTAATPDSALQTLDSIEPDTAGVAMSTQVAMSPLGSAAASGSALITATGSTTEVTVQLTGLPEGAHAGHIHQGTCEAPGSPVAPLQEVTAGQDGAGTITSIAEVDPMSVMDGNHIVAYHERGAPNPGAPIVCGQIPGHQM